MNERRFSEEEVAEILKQAVEIQDSGSTLPASQSGLTLRELKEIGREVGVAPEVIERAALRLDGRASQTRSLLGLPLGVGRTIELDRTLNEEEWERLVADLRQTFDARGVVRREGSLRSWSNGNLHVLLEPGSMGQRLRLRTVNGNAQAWTMGSLAMLGILVLMTVSALFKGTLLDDKFLTSATLLGGMSIGMFALGALRLPSWARRRQRQMDELADRVNASASDNPDSAVVSPEALP